MLNTSTKGKLPLSDGHGQFVKAMMLTPRFSAVNDIMNQEYLFMDDEFDERDADVGPMTQGLVSHLHSKLNMS